MQNRLVHYLKSTSEQWEQLQINAINHRNGFHEPNRRLEGLNRDVAAETQKPTLNPTEIGQRYRQIEDHCRSLVAPRTQL